MPYDEFPFQKCTLCCLSLVISQLIVSFNPFSAAQLSKLLIQQGKLSLYFYILHIYLPSEEGKQIKLFFKYDYKIMRQKFFWKKVSTSSDRSCWEHVRLINVKRVALTFAVFILQIHNSSNSWEKHGINPKWGTFYEIPDQDSLKSSKVRKVWETNAAKGSLRRPISGCNPEMERSH